ncbi:DNA translocase FtsK [uncultured Acetobacteroides sp.]|uniref:DNA translocase FtsK n=1 Tax=uncultured Acetobacteroides sp. TaxID=1760811 RepID=UPI0029F4B4EE|nr:DNA translocase FtsK [uncultured Acetobacteroides sp.]
MSTKEKTTKKETAKKENQVAENHMDGRYSFIVGIFILFFAAYLLLAIVSYFFTWESDQSFIWQKVFSSSLISVDNWTGKVGAFLSNALVNKGFGISAIGFPFIMALIGLRVLKFRPYPFRKTLRTLVLGIILLSVILGFAFGEAKGTLGSGLGGEHGYFVSKWMSAFIGKLGTFFVLLFVSIIYAISINRNTIFYINKTVVAVADLFRSKPATPLTESFEEEESVEEEVEVRNEEPKQKPAVKDTQIVRATETEQAKEATFTIVRDEEEEEDSYEQEDVNEQEEVNKSVAFPYNGAVVPPFDIDDKPVEPLTPILLDDSKVKFMLEQTSEEKDADEDVINSELYDPTLELSSYQRPPIELLEDYKSNFRVTEEELIANKEKIVTTLANYKIQIDSIKATTGPTVTLYEIVPAPGVKISKIKNLEDDIALNLAALGIRIIAPIPGKGTIGIEVPNQKPDVVSMLSILKSAKFQESKFDLPIGLGKTISNENFVVDLAKMPHLLVAGATGQGKSVGLNAILTSLLYKKHPSELKLVMVDPKKVELTLYSKIERHFLAMIPDSDDAIITDTQKVIYTLNSLCIEMDSRYDLLKKAQVRNIKEYNEKFVSRRLNPNNGHRFLPYIVVVIDEFADLIMTAGREIETPIARLAQLARAIGIHLVIATQRPTTNIITGVIKANFPARIAFRVTSMIDSRTILDQPGANQLIGRGDMLISTGSDLTRVQCAFVDTPEVERITDFIGNQRAYSTAYLLPEYVPEGQGDAAASVDLDKRDSLFDEAARLIVQNQQGSTSLIQRKFSIGYNRAGRIVDQLEAAGIIGPFEGSKARQVLITDELSLEHILNDLDNR